jgi:hypothetical protein
MPTNLLNAFFIKAYNYFSLEYKDANGIDLNEMQ